MKQVLDARQLKAWNIAIIGALVFGFFFLRGFFGIILVAAIFAYIFNPVHQRFLRRYKRQGISASLTFLVAMFAILIPLAIITLICFWQIKNLLTTLSTTPTADIANFGQTALDFINDLLAKVPGSHQITSDQLNQAVDSAITHLANGLLGIIEATVGNFTKVITNVVIFIYIFVNILMHQDKLIRVLKRLNPLGDNMSDLYLQKMGSMTTAMAKGQFVIATLQGVESSIVLYIAGFHHLFLFFVIFLSFLSLIPLGAGIVTIPIGIALILTGNVWQGVMVIANHLLVVTNIDNVMRPKLVPRNASLNSALTILSVFAGVAMFGFLGIIIGPVIMILLVSTIEVYVANGGASKTSKKSAV